MFSAVDLFGDMSMYLFILVVVGAGGANSQCSSTECSTDYFESDSVLQPNQTCYSNGMTVNISCPGEGGGPPNNLCNDGTWALPPSSCSVFTCPRPAVSNSVIISPDKGTYEQRETVVYSCKPGYEVTGAGFASCDAQDTWIPSYIPFCSYANGCDSDPCLNGGVCNDIGLNTFRCICQPGFNGTTCDNDIDECSSGPCHNSGTCVDLPNDFFCICPSGSSGFLCQIEPCFTPDIPNGFLEVSGQVYFDDYVRLFCSIGYSVGVGMSPFIRCGAGGIWDPTPECLELFCTIPTPSDDRVRITPNMNEYVHEAEIEFSCDGEFAVNGTTEASCYNGTWNPWDTPQCASFEKVEQLLNMSTTLSANSSTEEVLSVADVVVTATNDVGFVADDPERVELVITSLEAVANAGDSSSEVTKPVVNAINNLMEQEETSLHDTSGSGRVIAALERQISNRQSAQGDYTQILENIAVKAVKINTTTTTGPNLHFGNIFPDGDTPKLGEALVEDNTVLSQEPAPTENTATSISIPSTILDYFPNVTDIPITFLIFANDRLFVPSRRLNESNSSNSDVREKIASQIISAKKENTGLFEDVSVLSKFLWNQTVDESEHIEDRKCVFWSYDENSGEGFWSTEGCSRKEDEANLTVCSCKRLASFAVLIRIRTDKGVPHESLYWITLIGSIVSCVCLVASIITFFTLKNIRGKLSTYIHINLSISLIGFYVSFLLVAPALDNSIACAAVSASIHYFCLATTIWMSIEALNLYWVFSKTATKGKRKVLAASCVIGYGIPLIPTVLVAVLDNTIHDGMSDYCFIHPGPSLYSGLLAIVGILFLLNVCIFAWLVRKTLCRRLLTTKSKERARREEIIRRIRHGVLFWFILGLSWIFAALASVDSKTYTFEYLYSIFTAVQGVVLFLLLCVANPEFQKVFSRLRQTTESSTSQSNTTATTGTGNPISSNTEGASNVELSSMTNPTYDEQE